MGGFYERMKEAWNKIKDTLRPGRKVGSEPYEKLCSRFESSKPISVSELDDIKELCKAIVEPQCEKRIDDGFEVLKRIGAEKAERGIGAKWKRNECVGDGKGERKTKKHRKRGYQKKYALKKENDVSWGVLPKKYRVAGKTPMETIEKAICYDEEDNLFLHLGEVSTDEEEEYFCEKNVKKLNSGEMKGKVQCNFGGDYNCKRCVEYEIRKEYEAKEKERRREERERIEKRRKMARERWESRVPRSYFYLEKDLGVDRMMARYVTDDKFDIDDLEEGERKKLTNVLNQAKKERLFDIETLEGKGTGFDKDGDEVSKAPIVEDSGKKNDDVIPEVSWDRNTKGNGIDVTSKANSVSNSSIAQSYPILDPGSGDKENGSDTGQGEIDLDIKKDEGTVPPRMPFVFGETLSETVKHEEKEGLFEGKKNEEPKRFGFWDGRTPSLQGNASVFQFDSSISHPPTQDSPSTVNHESIASPFASDVKAPETKPFVFGGGSTLQPYLGSTQGSTELHSPSLGSSLFKRKLNGSGEVIQNSEATFPFGQEGNVFLLNNNGTTSNTQSFSSIDGVSQGQTGVPQQTGSTRPISNIFGNGKSLFGGLFEGAEPSQQPAKPSIGYADSNESGAGGLFGSGGIFNAADDDPFERNKLGGRR